MASVDDGIKMLSSVLENGSALEKFRSMIVAQGTAQNVASDLCAKGSDPFLYLPQAKYQTDLKTTSSGLDLTLVVILQYRSYHCIQVICKRSGVYFTFYCRPQLYHLMPQ